MCCFICTEYLKGALTADEARKNMKEIVMPIEAQEELEKVIAESKPEPFEGIW